MIICANFKSGNSLNHNHNMQQNEYVVLVPEVFRTTDTFGAVVMLAEAVPSLVILVNGDVTLPAVVEVEVRLGWLTVSEAKLGLGVDGGIRNSIETRINNTKLFLMQQTAW